MQVNTEIPKLIIRLNELNNSLYRDLATQLKLAFDNSGTSPANEATRFKLRKAIWAAAPLLREENATNLMEDLTKTFITFGFLASEMKVIFKPQAYRVQQPKVKPVQKALSKKEEAAGWEEYARFKQQQDMAHVIPAHVFDNSED